MIKSSNINIMSNAVLKASRVLRRDFNELEKLQNSLSKINIFVNKSLNNVKETIFKELTKARPEWKIFFFHDYEKVNVEINEESSIFLVNPISGVSNFTKGISYFAISITLINKGKQDATVIYDPIKDELFCAERGKGAYANNFRMRISSNKDLQESLLALESHELLIKEIKIFLKNKNIASRVFGSISLDFANLASGRIDCYISSIASNTFEPGLLLLKEAGGINSEMLNLNDIFFYSNNAISEIIKKSNIV